MSAAEQDMPAQDVEDRSAPAPRVGTRGRRVLLLGGTSEIGLAIVSEMARKDACEVLLAGRDGRALELAAERLKGAGCGRVVSIDSLDAADIASHPELLDRAFSELGGVDVAIVAVGVLGARGGLPEDVAAAVEVLHVNVCGASSLLMGVATRLRAQGGGTAIVLSSVAAERPRRVNAVYGASKAGIDSLAQALSDAMRDERVEVIVVRPGFVRSRMTRGLPVPPLACDPQDVARATVSGLERGAQTVWAPGAMRWAMLVLRMLPRALFRRLSV